jgi:hypothetical protein
MKLKSTDEKVTIKWFAVFQDGSKMRNIQGFQHNAWDVECSCGWKTRSGGAIKSYMIEEVQNHKLYEHDYQMVFRESQSTKEFLTAVNNFLNEVK